jgi:hypothetical protein
LLAGAESPVIAVSPPLSPRKFDDAMARVSPHSRYIAGTSWQTEPNVNADGRIEMTASTNTWIRRVTAGAVLAAASALIALDTATASYAESSSSSNSTSSTSFHQRHAAEVQSWYR